MQKLNVYSIFDEKGLCYGNPFYFCHDGEALRAFSDLVQDSKSRVALHPSDFKLYRLGSFDDRTGGLGSEKEPKFLANALDFVKAVSS